MRRKTDPELMQIKELAHKGVKTIYVTAFQVLSSNI